MVVPVVLAAGDSTRIGHPKALLPLGAETFLTHILGKLRALALPDPIVVLGAHAEVIRKELALRDARAVINPNPEGGQLSSLKLALDCMGGAEACLIWPVDQPLVSAGLVRDLMELFLTSGALLAMPAWGTRKGHPAIFHQALFEELRRAPSAEGAKSVVVRYAEKTALLPTEEIGAFEDIDTPEDYYRLMGAELESALRRGGMR